MILNHDDLLAMPSRNRATLINSLSGVKPAVLVGSKGLQQIENLAIFNSLLHIGAQPALMGLIFRPDKVRRDTLANIQEQKCYTINYVPDNQYHSAHQTAAKYKTEESEFNLLGFTPNYLDGFHAPYVKESPIHMGLEWRETVRIESNETLLVIGEIQYISIADHMLWQSFWTDLSGLLHVSGLDSYYRVQLMDRLSYAEPNKEPDSLL